jgi:AraC-like DNA-binding protein
MDVLSDVLNAVQLSGAVFFDVEAFSPWVGATPHVERFRSAVMPNAEHVIAFHIILNGSCWAEIPDCVPPTRLRDGDLVVFPMGDEHILSSEPGLRAQPNVTNYRRPPNGRLPIPFVINQGGGPDQSHFVCGYLGCSRRPFNPLLEALPRMFHESVSDSSREWMLSLIRAATAETESGTPGGETMLAKVAELMFVEAVRKYMQTLATSAPGWCSGLRDAKVGAALRLIHARPAHQWSVEELARQVGMSRSLFADRFVHFVGTPPMHYLAKWRLQVAAHLLVNRALSTAQVAAKVGYDSEAAFNRAFKRYVGLPPGLWRKSRLDGRATPDAELRP